MNISIFFHNFQACFITLHTQVHMHKSFSLHKNTKYFLYLIVKINLKFIKTAFVNMKDCYN